jgi:hypothetical protein
MSATSRQVIGRRFATISLCVVMVGLWLLSHLGRRDGSFVASPQQVQASAELSPVAPERPPAAAAPRTGSVDSATSVAAASRSPAEITQLLQTLHQQHDYAAIGPLIVADRRAAMLKLLRAIDDVLSANNELQDAARQAFGAAVTGIWDISVMENNIGPFSSRVAVINQTFKGNTATVTLQEGDNVPLARVPFDWVGDCWQYRPEATPAQILPELGTLAGILRELANSTREGASFDACFDAFTERVFPQMRRIMTASDDRPSIVTEGDSAE